MTYEPDDIAHVRLPLISLVLLVALPAALIPVLQFLSISAAGNEAGTAGNAAGSFSLAAQPGSVIAGSIIGLLVAYVIGGRKAMFLAVLSIVVAIVAMLTIGSPATFQWGRTTLNLGAGALLVLPILILGHYGSHRQISAGMPGLILGPFILVALVGLLTRPVAEDRIAAITNGAGGIEPMGWLAIVLTVLLLLALFRAMGRARGGRPNALFSPELRADARTALGFILTGPQIYALLIAMALTGHAANTYLGDFARKSPLEGFGIDPTIAATLCLGFGGFLFARIFGPRRRQHVLATTIIFLLITTGLMADTDIMFAPTTGSLGVFVWPYTQKQLVLLVLTCGAMAMLGASFAMIWLSIVEVGLGVLATILLITVLVARIAAPALAPLVPIPGMWLATGLLGAAMVLVTLGTGFGRRAHSPAPRVPPEEFAAVGPAEQFEQPAYDEPDEQAFEPEITPGITPAPEDESEPEYDTRPVAPEPAVSRGQPGPEIPPSRREPDIQEPTAQAKPPSDEPVSHGAPEEPATSGRPKGGLPWRRRRTKRDALARAVSSARTEPGKQSEPPARKEPRTQDRHDPSPRANQKGAPPTGPDARHEAVQDTHIDWAKLGATVVEDDAEVRNEPAPANEPDEQNTREAPSDNRQPRKDDRPTDDPAAPVQTVTPPQPAERSFRRHDSTIFDFDRLRENTRRPDEANNPSDEGKE